LGASTPTLGSGASQSSEIDTTHTLAVKDAFEDSRMAGKISEALAVLAGCFLVATATLSGWTYLFHPVDLQFGEVVPLWLLMFVPCGWAVYLQQRELLTVEDLSRRMRALLVAVSAAFVLNAVVFFGLVMTAHPSGQPGRDPVTHQYEVGNHGSITIVSRSLYESLVLKYDRLLLAWPALFVAVALPVIVNEAVRVRRLRAKTHATLRPHAKDRRA
jgi:hypothetical protein